MTHVDSAGSYLSDCDPHDSDLSARPAKAADLTPDAIAAFLDQDAENDNNHGFVGVHNALCEMMSKYPLVTARKPLMLKILERGGLHNMVS